MSKKNKTSSGSAFGSRVTSVISVALTLVIIGLLAQTAVIGHHLTDSVRRSLTATVQAVPGANDIALNRIKRLISANPAVASYTFVTSDQVLAQEVLYIGEEIATLLDENPYSAEYEVHFRPEAARKNSIEDFCKQMQADPAVETVLTDMTVVDNVNRTFSRLTLGLTIVGAVLLVISLALIQATVSLSIYSRRFLIRTMKLVGASPSFICAPFVRAGLVNGLIAGLTASALLAAAQSYAMYSGSWLAPMLNWGDAALVYVGLVVLGMLICPLAAWIAATRYLHRNYDSLYRK